MVLQMIFLGTGTSAGVPMIGCRCGVCTSSDPRNVRSRSSVLLRWDDPTFAVGDDHVAFNSAQAGCRQYLIDATPDLRNQAITQRLSRLDGVLITHAHADHVFGLDDLRRFNAVMQQPIPLYAEVSVQQTLGQMFRHIFQPHTNVNPSFVADLQPHLATVGQPLDLPGAVVTPLRLLHGRLPIVGYRVDYAGRSLAYCTDVSGIPPETLPLLDGLDVLVLDALRFRHHPTHLSIDQALEWVRQIRPKQAYFTHLAHDIDHATLSADLPPGVALAYDGLVVTVDAA